MVPDVGSEDVSFSAWVPSLAKEEFVSLSRQDKFFLVPLFGNKDLKGFWSDFQNAGRGFFCEFYMHLLSSYAQFEKLCQEHEQCLNEGLSLKDREREMAALRGRISDSSALSGLLAGVDEAQNKLDYDHWKHKKNIERLTKKNRFRPRNRESFATDKKPQKQARFLAVGLYHFFQKDHIQSDWKKSDARVKHHVCNIVDALLDRPDDPLTLPVLNDALRNFQNRA